jgi:WD40 repeat protein
VWNPITGKHISTYRKHLGNIYAVAWSPDGKRVASGGYDQTVQIWDALSGKALSTYRGHTSIVGAIAWSPDGQFIASGSIDGVIRP